MRNKTKHFCVKEPPIKVNVPTGNHSNGTIECENILGCILVAA